MSVRGNKRQFNLISGYRILSHSGTTFGYIALLTLFPDINLGVFTALTCEDRSKVFRTILHNYLADMYIGETPWLNKTTLCTFPEPFYKPFPKRVRRNIERYRKLARNVSEYAGTYYNPAYKHLKIIPKFPLEMEYGFAKFKLYAKTNKDHFYIDSYGLTEYTTFGSVEFHVSDGTVRRIEIPAFDSSDPPVFVKQTLNTFNGVPCTKNIFFIVFLTLFIWIFV